MGTPVVGIGMAFLLRPLTLLPRSTWISHTGGLILQGLFIWPLPQRENTIKMADSNRRQRQAQPVASAEV
jgi:hypothetical protein